MKKKISNTNLLAKGLKLSLINLWRNKFLSLATIFVMGIIIFIFNVILGINSIATESLENLSKKIDIVVYVKETANFSDTQSFMEEIASYPEVTNVEFTSKDDAINQLKITHPDITLAFEKYELENPLPSSVNITTQNPEDHEVIATRIKESQLRGLISSITTNEDSSTGNSILTSVSKKLVKLSTFTKQIIFWLVLTFVVGGILITLNALQITIFSRRKEIGVMKLVGAPFWFIRLPFIIEAVIYGILSVILSFIMLYALSRNIPVQIDTAWVSIFLIELGAAVAISVFSSMVAVHEYLLKKTL
jgi:cell division transport system permease protein